MSPTYDIIFAGGGAAACLTAGRLAKADPSLKILVLEAGPHTRELQAHAQPARFLSHLFPTSTTVTFNEGIPSKELLGRSPIVPSGRCVGGGSSVNFAMYTRASASDYDDWGTVYDNSGWGSKDLIPLLRKTETYQVKEGEPTHGYDGPLKVSYGGAYTNIGKEFLQVTAQYDKTRGQTDDVNRLFSCNEYGRWLKWIDNKTGKRSDVPHHFIYNQDNENLQVFGECRVKRVVIENNRAVGVEYVNDPTLAPDADQTLHVARASRLVVVSAGAFGSPTILERSGIGSKEIVEKAGVKSIVDLPGVGQCYQDHNLVATYYLASEDSETLDAIFRDDKEEVEKQNKPWTEEGKGLMAHNAMDAGIKLRPSAEELKDIGPEFQSRWESYFADSPDKAVIWMGPAAGFLGDPSTVPPRKYFGMGNFTLYPVASGCVHIKSDSPHTAPYFDPNFLSNSADLALLRWSYKRTREFARRMDAYRGEFIPANPVFPESSQAFCKDANGPVVIGASDIVYTTEDDKAIDEFIRKSVQTTWHSLGTCAMKPRGKGGVVDRHLNVYGIEGLKVADISIAPGNVGSNTYSTALVIGEKAALIISQELGISGV